MAAVEAITTSLFGRHDCPGHPESQSRLEQVLGSIPEGVQVIESKKGAYRDLARIIDKTYIKMVKDQCSACQPGECHYLDMDTYITRDSYGTALCASGSAVNAVDRAWKGSHCFALVRPPGHHSGRNYAMGFCIFNNVAVAAAYALERCDRVAIVDWDVHHGNGTQEIFYSSGKVLYCSVHQSSHYPYSGFPHETGTGEGEGLTINVPLPSGSTIMEYGDAFMHRILPGIRSFSPDLIVVSAGQDCLFDDPLGEMQLTPPDFADMTGWVRGCTEAPLVLVLEGGYGPSHGDAIQQIFSTLSV